MTLIFYTILAVYLVCATATMRRIWYYRTELLKHVEPDREPFDMRGDLFFDTTRFTPAGKDIHRKMMSFLWKAILILLSGPIVLGILAGLQLGR